jgi:hypothetical protein
LIILLDFAKITSNNVNFDKTSKIRLIFNAVGWAMVNLALVGIIQSCLILGFGFRIDLKFLEFNLFVLKKLFNFKSFFGLN